MTNKTINKAVKNIAVLGMAAVAFTGLARDADAANSVTVTNRSPGVTVVNLHGQQITGVTAVQTVRPAPVIVQRPVVVSSGPVFRGNGGNNVFRDVVGGVALAVGVYNDVNAVRAYNQQLAFQESGYGVYGVAPTVVIQQPGQIAQMTSDMNQIIQPGTVIQTPNGPITYVGNDQYGNPIVAPYQQRTPVVQPAPVVQTAKVAKLAVTVPAGLIAAYDVNGNFVSYVPAGNTPTTAPAEKSSKPAETESGFEIHISKGFAEICGAAIVGLLGGLYIAKRKYKPAATPASAAAR